uniref:RRM domain-containing protein n=1 Tax=Triticum urartu TaxID=4572 RepID=A0A8R7TFN1_TRIUA
SIAAAAGNCRCSRVVYVGNIPFKAEEKEVRDACELIGPVLSFNLAADADTGKRKGYAFVEYADDATAQSACRNLHGHRLLNRELRVGLAERAGAYVPGLDIAMEMVQRLLDMAAADEAAGEAKRKKRAS